jgi:hypothetical protein
VRPRSARSSYAFGDADGLGEACVIIEWPLIIDELEAFGEGFIEGFVDGFIEDIICPDIMDAEGLGEGDGVPMPSARAGAIVRAASTRASAYGFKEEPPMIAGVFLMYAAARRADYSAVTKATLRSWR